MSLNSSQKDMIFELMEIISDATKIAYTEDGDSFGCICDIEEINKKLIEVFDYDFLEEASLRLRDDEREISDSRNAISLL